MKKAEVREIVEKLLEEVEEEDIGISLISTHYQAGEELDFFVEADRERVGKVLKRLSDDSRRHKQILERIIVLLGKKIHEN